MTKVFQTEFKDDKLRTFGNCWIACLATLVGVPIDHLPSPEWDCDWHVYQANVREILRNHFGLQVVTIYGPYSDYATSQYGDSPYYIASGKSPRGDYLHAVVYQNGKLVHDPHPSGHGIGQVEFVELLVPLEPWTWQDA